MRLRSWYAALCAAGVGLGASAQAHEFICEKTLDGARLQTLTRYPATLRYHFTVTNSHPTDTSVALRVEDALLAPRGFHFTPSAPFSVPVGQSVSSRYELTLKDEAECLALAAADGTADRSIDNTLVVTWDSGSTLCSARAVCGSPSGGGGGGGGGEGPPPPECPSGQGTPRGLGFWKTHVDAASACVAAGPLPVGIATLTTLAEVEGLLWGSPAKFADGTRRGDLDQKRFLLARELLVATCNVRVFGAVPSSPDLFSGALSVLAGTDCTALSSYGVRLERLQECGKDTDPTQRFGKADPKLAQRIAKDPSAPSAQTCDARGGGNGHGGGK